LVVFFQVNHFLAFFVSYFVCYVLAFIISTMYVYRSKFKYDVLKRYIIITFFVSLLNAYVFDFFSLNLGLDLLPAFIFTVFLLFPMRFFIYRKFVFRV